MTPKEKAYEMFKKYYEELGLHSDYFNKAKQCALILVDEILNLCWNGNLIAKEYWQQVRQEIENL